MTRRAAKGRRPAERNATARQEILALLEGGPLTVRDLAHQFRIPEKDVVRHLEHLERTLRHGPRRLAWEPACCRACGYVFVKRRKLATPGTCPSCRDRRIDPPRFRLVEERRVK